MITILCGPDFVASRQKLSEFKTQLKTSEITTLYGRDLDDATLYQEISSPSFFADQKLLIIENFFSQKKTPFNIFDDLPQNINLLLWESSDLPTGLRLPKDVNIIHFRGDPLVYHYLDSLKPGNRQKAFNLLWQTKVRGFEESLIFYLLVRHLRYLLAAKSQKPTAFFNFEKQPQWLLEKYQRLALDFDLENLKKLFSFLFEVDWRLKRGQLANLEDVLFFLTYRLTAKKPKR